MMLIPFCAVLTRLPSNVYIWFVPSLMLPYYIWFQLSKCQGLRHFKAKAKGAEDSEELASFFEPVQALSPITDSSIMAAIVISFFMCDSRTK